MIDRPKVVSVPGCDAVAIHLQIPRSAVEKAMDGAIGEIMDALADQRVEPV